jgi:hypothetical protein
MADLKNYNTLYCPDDPVDAETMSARKRGRKSVDKTVDKDDGSVTFEHRTAARGYDNSNSSNNNHSFGGLRFPGNFADNGGEGNSYQYNQYSSGYSDLGATSIGNDAVIGTAITVNAATVGAATVTNNASATVDSATVDAAAAATYYNAADDSEPRINDGTAILPDANARYEYAAADNAVYARPPA